MMIGFNRNASHRYPRNRRRGFVATVTAVTLMALVTISLTAVVAATVADTRRTRQMEIDAQFRQLFRAGAADAAAHAESWGDAPPPQSWALALPDALTEQGFHVQLAIVLTQPGATEVLVNADGPAARRAQTLRFVRSAGEWKIGGDVVQTQD